MLEYGFRVPVRLREFLKVAGGVPEKGFTDFFGGSRRFWAPRFLKVVDLHHELFDFYT